MIKTTLISVRVPRETARRLRALAEATDRSKSYVAAQAIEEFISLQEWQVKAIQQGIEDADAGKLSGHDAAKARLAKWKRRRGA
jgi:predicted transcriptional regulator